ncbi:MAG: hypothetical protein SOW80_02840 [Anaerovoracaceae bacterium]|nr:hypothetical protein [Anaerovoracaceae bacterium]
MKKYISVVLILALAVLCFTGCMSGEDKIIINEDGSGQSYSRIVMDKAVADQMLQSFDMTLEDLEMGEARVETVDGKESYVIEETMDFSDYEALKEGLESSGYSGIYASENGLRFVFSADVSKEDVAMMEELGFDLGDSMKASVSITMPNEITKTTGTLSEDKKTATFVFEGNDLYKTQDIMVSAAQETKKPTLSGVTSKKTYGSAKTVIAKDASGIKTAKYKRNDGKYYSFTADLQKTFTKNGKYTVYATDYYGNKMVKTFTIKDTTRPTVSGVTSGKTYSSERTLYFKDNCEVKSVKCYIDGERATLPDDYLVNGVLASESGAYKFVVTDVNGNTRTVKFKIK